MSRPRASARLSLIVLAALAYGCTGEGCDCLADLKEDFPFAAKQRAGLQVRVTESGLQFLSENAFDLLSEQIGDTLTFPVPANCSSDPTVCCGYPEGFCSMELDLRDYGEGSHFDVEALDATGNRLGITLYPRVRTLRPMPARTFGPLGGAIDCNVEFNTRWAGTRWMSIYFEVILGEDDETGELGVEVTTAQVGGISSSDISIYGDFLCRFGSEQDAINGIASGFSTQVPGAIEEFLCKTCDSDSQCGPGASCDEGVCRSDSSGNCRQGLALTGQHHAGSLLGPLLGQALSKKLDIYFAAGSDAVSEDDGLSLAVTSGMEPAASPDDHGCVPVLAPPASTSMPLADELRGNTNPKTGASFDLGAAIHVDALNRGAWAAHQAGYICLNLGSQGVDLLNSDAMLLVAPSLGRVLGNQEKQPMYVLVRPQTAPSIVLGAGTFIPGDEGPTQIDDPLLRIGLTDLELDFYVLIDDRYSRIFTVVADADIGVSLDVDADGSLVPLLDDPASALSNIRAKNLSLMTETEAEVADRIPPILGVALGNLSSELGESIALPELAGLGVSLGKGAFTSVDNKTRLAMFADLAPGGGTDEETNTILEAVSLDREAGTLSLSVEYLGAPLEWQFRLGNGFWSPFTQRQTVTVHRQALTVSGHQTLEVRARKIGQPRSLDRSPARVDLAPDPALDSLEPIGFHGEGEAGGCQCNSSGDGLGSGVLALIAIAFAFGRRRTRTRAGKSRLEGFVVTALVLISFGTMPACSCGESTRGESDLDDPNQVQPGPIGRWVSVASNGSRVLAASYDRERGDLVISEIDDDGEPRYRAIDGVPDGPVTKDAEGYRDGIDASGPDVGAWATMVFAAGTPLIAYQDRDRAALVLARETSNGYERVDIDVPTDTTEVGRYASIAVSSTGAIGISYLAVRVEVASDQSEVVHTELRFASAASSEGPFAIEVVATAQADHASRVDVPAGVGLWSSLAFRESEPAIAHYDSVAGNLVLAWRADGEWSHVIVDGEGDRGQYASLVSAGGDELIVAYQDVDADRLLLRRMAGAVIDSAEVIDDGRREGERNHPVGASASLRVDASELIVAYQDSASNTLVLARRPRDGGAWSRDAGPTAATGFGIGLTDRGDVHTVSGTYDPERGRLDSQRW